MTVLAQGVTQLQETSFALQRLLPRVLACVAILAIGYLAARLLTRLIARLLANTGFERMAHQSDAGDMVGGRDVTALLTRVVFGSLMLVVAQLAFAVFGPNPVATSLAGVIAFLPRLIVAIVIVVIAAAIASAARQLVAARARELSYAPTLAACAYAVVLGIGVFAALDQLQVAPAIVNGLFYALLAIVVGVTVVAVGGGGIGPMRQRWEQALTRLDSDAARLREMPSWPPPPRADAGGGGPGAGARAEHADDVAVPTSAATSSDDNAGARTTRRPWGETDRPPIRYRAVRRYGDTNEGRTRPSALPPWDSEH